MNRSDLDRFQIPVPRKSRRAHSGQVPELEHRVVGVWIVDDV